MDMLTIREESTSLEVKYIVILCGMTLFLGNVKKNQLTLERISNIRTQCGYYQSQTSWTQVFYWSYWQECGWAVTYRNRSDSKAVALPKITLAWVTALNSWKQSWRQLDILSILFSDNSLSLSHSHLIFLQRHQKYTVDTRQNPQQVVLAIRVKLGFTVSTQLNT